MAKFNPKKHDLKPSEAKFLTELSKLSVTDLKNEIEASAKEITQTKADIEKAKALIDKRITSALAEAKKAGKKYDVMKKKLDQVDALFWLIEKSPPVVGNAIAKRLGKLTAEVGKTQSNLSTSLNKASSDIASAGITYQPFVPWLGPSAGVVPSLPKVIVMAP